MIALLAATTLLQSPKILTLGDLDLAVSLSTPEISPDGKQIAVIVGRPKVAENTSVGEIDLVDTATGAVRPLTFERRGVAMPKWSPNGDRLAFLAVAPNGVREVYVMSMTGGGDARRITDAKAGIQQFAWRPDGNAIAYAAQDDLPEKKGLDKFDDLFEVGDNDFLQRESPVSAHLWMVHADGKNPQRLTSGSWTLPVSFPPGPPSSPLSWTPDGKSIAIVRQDDPHSGDGDKSSVQIIDVATKAIRALTKKTELESFPQVSPDGSHIAYLYPRDSDWNQNTEIFLAPSGGGAGKSISSGLDRCLYRSEWMPGGKSLLVAGHDSTQVGYWIQPVDGPARKLDLGSVSPTHSYWPQYTVAKDGTIAFLASEPDRPIELYTVREGSKPVRLTDFNHDLDHRKVTETRLIEWQSGKSKVNGPLTLPANFDAAKKYPVVLMIHGGPNSASILAFNLVAHAFAEHGYAIFQPNYRGSDNLGKAFYKAIEHDAGDGPGKDVMAGMKELEKLPYIDASKVAVTGWSYGGFMTSWLASHYGGWTCAVAGAPVTDYVEQYNLSDGSVSWRQMFGKSPYVGNAIEEYRANSPITYAAKIKTPTLIMCDTGDFRVPIAQSYALYHALRDNGTPVQFVAVPVDGHFAGDRARIKLVYGRWIDWVDKYLGGKAP